MKRKTLNDYESKSVSEPSPYKWLKFSCLIYPKNKGVARTVYQLRHGKLNSQFILICHHCDRPKCIRDEHHFLGTKLTNLMDASRKGRLFRTVEARAKIAAAQKGNKYRVGMKHTAKAKLKMRQAHLGRKLSTITRSKMSKAAIGNQNARRRQA